MQKGGNRVKGHYLRSFNQGSFSVVHLGKTKKRGNPEEPIRRREKKKPIGGGRDADFTLRDSKSLRRGGDH